MVDDRLARPDQARLDFIEGVKSLVAARLAPALRGEYEDWARDKPEATLRDRGAMAERFENSRIYQAGRGLARLSQEAMWREVRAGYAPHRAQLQSELLVDPPAGSGVTLALNPALPMPCYFSGVPFHLQTDGFDGDPLAGLIYETGVATYSMHRYGRGGAEMGRALLAALPRGDFRRILYLGCGPAYKGYPIREAFPDAEFHAVDIAEPMLRYAAHRAGTHGQGMAFHQMNAETPDFPDGSFDLVFCILLLHEIPLAAIRNVVRQSHRLLAPGGVFANAELPGYAAVDPLSAYLLDWDSDHNGEPYWRAYHELDLDGLLTETGFRDVGLGEQVGAGGTNSASYVGRFRYHVNVGVKP